MDRYCLPDDASLANATINAFMNNFYNKYHVSKFTDYISDLYSVWYVMIICVGAAFVLGFIYMYLLKCFAGVILFFSLAAVFFLIGGLGIWAYFTKNDYSPQDKNYKYL